MIKGFKKNNLLKLETLALQSCSKITDKGLRALNCPALKKLDLSWCFEITILSNSPALNDAGLKPIEGKR